MGIAFYESNAHFCLKLTSVAVFLQLEIIQVLC
jgi:hypothetical protein